MSNDITKQIMDRLMNLQEFTVSVPVEENWMPNGRVPFDIKIKSREWLYLYKQLINKK